MKSIALITCRELPEPDPDEALLCMAIRDAGMNVEMIAWDDPTASPARFDLCRLHSCWNYYHDPAAFLDWIDHAATVTRLENSADIVHWNFHKRYLLRLNDAGVPVIPTVLIERGEDITLVEIMEHHGWDDVVIKPAISASSFGTQRFHLQEAGRRGGAYLEVLVRERDVLVQQYMRSVETTGERSLVWIDGTFTHHVRKQPRFAGGIQQTSDALPVIESDRDVALRALACVDGNPLYARIDIVDDDRGNPVVSELELMEPSLFLLESPEALDRLVGGIAAR